MAQNLLQDSKAWGSLSKLLPPRNSDEDFWWKKTGPHLAAMLEAAQYSPERQYDALLFHYHWIVPYLGKALDTFSERQWSSVLGVEGLPIEYSWKWNSATKKPEVRYGVEPIGRFSGTELDPLNHDATRELLHRLKVAIPSLDTSMVDHFVSTFYDANRFEYAQQTKAGVPTSTTLMIAVEFKGVQPMLKTYILPRKLGQTLGRIPMSLFKDSLSILDFKSAAQQSVYDFLESNTEGRLLNVFLVAVDNVAPVESRLKLYCHTPRTNFKSVREIMTLGGRIDVPEAKFQDLKTLIASATGLTPDFAEDAEIPLRAQHKNVEVAFADMPILLHGMMYYFDIGARGTLPDVKLYLLVRNYGPGDNSLADGITAWMKQHGRGQYCEGYVSMVHELCEKKQLDGSRSIQTYISCMFKKDGELEITSYLAPEILAETEGTLQQKDIAIRTRSTLRRGSN
ncbi:dimethylallyl tryptophan synthase GliD1 [Metarhizium album ARSEF 1941]|uniref:Dimethylallyl tryptophan synthase GliD1 n=1 Tax=Metarhizium album (strain ARSEF 1941) TaxID=1081103 RepID=A0A0B2WKD0_METAS|nr:dimethylallyl tryptophan synthase GliD1 [Metarhizium album ARSEF 1941]KHN94378.1 dimethylallyl tryptophan synthase GliD1 [Metarhizium album ARSEF 1941]